MNNALNYLRSSGTLVSKKMPKKDHSYTTRDKANHKREIKTL